MKKLKLIILSGTLILSIFLISCDDAGQEKQFVQKGIVTFTHNNLKTLNPAIDGLYALWLGLGTAPGITWYDLGHFNISSAGEIVDSTGYPLTFTYNGDTNNLGDATVACVTLGYNPNYKVLLSSQLSITADSIVGHLSISGSRALGEAGARILGEGYPRATGSEILASPTTNNANCRQGIWFCDSLGNNSFSDGLSLTPGKGWVFEGWIHDVASNRDYSTGRFHNFYNADNDGAGPCKGPNGNGFNKPGQDFINTGPGCPVVTNIGNGSTGIFITLEPENDQALNLPFYLKIFWRQYFSPTVRCNFNYPYLANQYLTMPSGTIHISY